MNISVTMNAFFTLLISIATYISYKKYNNMVQGQNELNVLNLLNEAKKDEESVFLLLSPLYAKKEANKLTSEESKLFCFYDKVRIAKRETYFNTYNVMAQIYFDKKVNKRKFIEQYGSEYLELKKTLGDDIVEYSYINKLILHIEQGNNFKVNISNVLSYVYAITMFTIPFILLLYFFLKSK